MDNKELIKNLISESIETKKKMLEQAQIENIALAADKIVEAYRNGAKTIICGNGGSTADSLHFATEMLVRFEKNRPALASISLAENVSTITAIGNDFGFENSFSRQIEAFAKKGDIFIAISTSGNSKNVLNAIEAAKKMGIFVIGMTNENGGAMKELCDICFLAPSKITARVQECHILFIHIIARFVEDKVFEK